MRVRSPLVLAALASSSMLTGCGPILSTYLVVDAEAKLAAAKAAQADNYAIYEYVAAEQYLQKAHEELGYADYGPAIDYAYKAGELAAQGSARANEERSKHLEDKPPEETTTPAAAVTTPPAAPPVIIKKIPDSTSPGGTP